MGFNRIEREKIKLAMEGKAGKGKRGTRKIVLLLAASIIDLRFFSNAPITRETHYD